MYKRFPAVFFSLNLATSAFAFEGHGEVDLVKLIRGLNPTKMALDQRVAAAKNRLESFSDQYTAQLYANVSHQNATLRPLNKMSPVFGPSFSYETGLRSQFQHGLSASIGLYANKRSSTDGAIDDDARVGIKLKTEIDLWKNFLGKKDSIQKNALENAHAIELVQAKVQIKELEIEIRKLYWSLVANHRALDVTQELLTLAMQQQNEAQKRIRLSIAESDEIARYAAQVAKIRGSIYALQYEKKNLQRHLFTLVPEIQGKTLDLNAKNAQRVTPEIFACTSWIIEQDNPPWTFSAYQEILNLESASYEIEKNNLKSYDEVELSFFASYDLTNNSRGFAHTIESFSEDQFQDQQVGLSLSMPLGGQLQRSKDEKIKIGLQHRDASAAKIKGLVSAHHITMQESVTLLNKILKAQKESSEQLTLVQEASAKRYQIARIPVEVLIQDQNTMQSSLIDQTKAQLAVMHAVLDYFKVFTSSPCELNQI